MPGAALIVPGASTDVVGRVGSYTFGTVANEAPWLPARILPGATVPSGAKLTVRFVDGTSISGWGARYAGAADEQAVTVKALGASVEAAPDIQEIPLPAPPPGDWVVAVTLDYPGGLGSGVYYWHVTVTP